VPENFFEHYVMGGGWAMLILVPASIVSIATALRAAMMLWGRSVARQAAVVEAAVATRRSRGAVSLADARIIAMDSAMGVYVALMPLSIIYAAAPVVGALGSVWSLAVAWRNSVSLQARYLASALEHAFMPLGWGLVVSLISIVCYGILKARLVHVERAVLVPAALSALTGTTERKPGERKI